MPRLGVKEISGVQFEQSWKMIYKTISNFESFIRLRQEDI